MSVKELSEIHPIITEIQAMLLIYLLLVALYRLSFWFWLGVSGIDTGCHGSLARYVKLRFAHAPGMPGTFSLPPRVSDPDMHHGTCFTHVPWCMSGSLTSGFSLKSVAGENVPGIPGACATPNFTYLVRGPWWWYPMSPVTMKLASWQLWGSSASPILHDKNLTILG